MWIFGNGIPGSRDSQCKGSEVFPQTRFLFLGTPPSCCLQSKLQGSEVGAALGASRILLAEQKGLRF